MQVFFIQKININKLLGACFINATCFQQLQYLKVVLDHVPGRNSYHHYFSNVSDHYRDCWKGNCVFQMIILKRLSRHFELQVGRYIPLFNIYSNVASLFSCVFLFFNLSFFHILYWVFCYISWTASYAL